MAEKITVRCTSCAATLSVPDSAAGKKIRCPKCSTVMSVLPEQNSKFGNAGPTSAEDKRANNSSWSTDASDESEWSIDDSSEPEWATDSYSQSPSMRPPIPKKNGKPTAKAEMSGRKSERGKQPDNQSKPETAPVASDAKDKATGGLSKTVLAFCIAAILVAGGVGGTLIYRTESAKVVRITEQLLADAKRSLTESKPEEATRFLQQYVSSPLSTEKSVAKNLLRQLAVATSETDTRSALAAMSDEQFARTLNSGFFDDEKVKEPSIVELRKQTISKVLPIVVGDRKAAADNKRLEAEQAEALVKLMDEQRKMDDEKAPPNNIPEASHSPSVTGVVAGLDMLKTASNKFSRSHGLRFTKLWEEEAAKAEERAAKRQFCAAELAGARKLLLRLFSEGDDPADSDELNFRVLGTGAVYNLLKTSNQEEARRLLVDLDETAKLGVFKMLLRDEEWENDSIVMLPGRPHVLPGKHPVSAHLAVALGLLPASLFED